MVDTEAFRNTELLGGFRILYVRFTDEPMLDAIGREAIAKTGIVGSRFDILIKAGLVARELSVTLYHEVLEAATLASSEPPASVIDFIESDFERTAYSMHDVLGEASPHNLNRML